MSLAFCTTFSYEPLYSLMNNVGWKLGCVLTGEYVEGSMGIVAAEVTEMLVKQRIQISR
jgi:hypothetical protein